MAEVAMLQSVGLSAVERPLYDLQCKKQLSLPFFERCCHPLLLHPHVCFFFSQNLSPNATTHTHEYRAFQYRLKAAASGRGGGCWFEPRTVHIVNIGPAFRGSYDSFAPVAPFPWFSRPLEVRDFRLENNSFLRFSSEEEKEDFRRRNYQSKDDITVDVIIINDNNRQDEEKIL